MNRAGPFSARVIRVFPGTDKRIDQDGLRVYDRSHPLPVPAVDPDPLGKPNGFLGDVDGDRAITEDEAIAARNLCLDARDAIVDQSLTFARSSSGLEGAFDLLARTTGSMTCQHFARAFEACLSTVGMIHAVARALPREHDEHVQDLLPRRATRADIEKEGKRLLQALPTMDQLRKWQHQDPSIKKIFSWIQGGRDVKEQKDLFTK